MGNTITVNKDYNFTGIFPTCTKVYREEADLKKKNPHRLYKDICEDIRKEIRDNYYIFNISCQQLSLYLDHINSTSISNKEPYCKYFGYKLKDELFLVKPTCYGEEDCYAKMMSIKKANMKHVSNVCQNKFKDLDEGTFYVMKKLDELYGSYELLKNGDGYCNLADICANTYVSLLKISQNSNNNTFSKLLEEFRDQYNSVMRLKSECTDVPKTLYSYYGRYAHKAFLSSFIVLLSLIIIIFILYKYTNYISYLPSTIKYLKALWDKRKEALKLNNSFNTEYKNINDKQYQILYNTS
ncbi:variable surface protein [Plasmodium gonderi]|uniref:Variable surface protein n=1 Tax=Plasmodium gonderi TaxID=77519 RepID=A0A1Y1JSY4_PLAGO|nr:variable surface protein [Plasmodium gonderi]GAW84548.1 variable surface protein [Plasmodium gonderi]